MLRYVRLTNSGKLADRYVTTQVKEASDPDAQDRGRIFAVVEIENPWFPTSQIGQTIINTVAREYFRGTSEAELDNFEAALKKVNDTLNHLVQTGETDWVGHLNAIIALAVGDELHIASVGQVHGWLVRAGKANRAIEATGTPPPPGKTFGSVLSGTLEPGDRVLLASSGIVTVVTQAELATNVFSAKEFGAGAVRLASLLRAKRGQWINALLIEQPDPDEASTPQAPLQNTLYLDTGNLSDWRLTLSGAVSNAHQAVLRAGAVLAKADRKTNTFMRQRVLPQGQKTLQRGASWSAAFWQTLRTNTLPAIATQASAARQSLAALSTSATSRPSSPSQAANTISSPETAPTVELDLDRTPAHPEAQRTQNPGDSLIGKPLYTIRDYHDGSQPETTGTLPTSSAHIVRDYTAPTPPKPLLPQLALPKLSGSLSGLGQRVASAPLWRSKSVGFGIIALILIAVLVVNLRAISIRQATTQNREQAEAALASLEDNLEEAKLAKIFNQPDKAAELLGSILAGLDGLTASPVATQAETVREETQAQLDTLTSTTRLASLTELATLSNGKRLSLWHDRLTIDASDGLATIATTGGEISRATLPEGEALATMATFDEKEGLALLSVKPNGYELTSASGPISRIGTEWKNGTALAAYFNNLYALSPTDNEIWKYESNDGQIQAPVAYIADDSSVSEGVDIAIDGSVYVLTKSGEIVKFSRGKRAELAVRDIPKPTSAFTHPTQIITTRDGNSLYILDGNRVVALDKTGRFQAQYAFKGITNVKSIAIDEANKTLYLLADDKLYKTSF